MTLTMAVATAAFAAESAAPPAAAASAPASPALLPVEMFYRHPDLGAARLSPSGRHLAVSLTVRDRRALAVLDLQSSEPPKLLQREDDADLRDFHWVNDERLVFSLIQLDRGNADQQIGPGLFSIGRDGSGGRTLIRPHWGIGPGLGTVAVATTLDPDHRLVMVPSGGGNEVVVGKWLDDAKQEFDSVVPMRLNVLTGRTRPLPELPPGGLPEKARGWLFDPQGAPRVAVSRHQGETTLHWLAPGSRQWQVLSRHPVHHAPFSPHSVDAAGQLLVTVRDAQGLSVLTRFDFQTGKPDPVPMARAAGFDFNGNLVYDEAASDRQAPAALGLRLTTDAETTQWFSPRMQALQQAVDQRLPGRINRISCARCEADDAVLLVWSWSDQDPGQAWLHRPASQQWQRLAAVRKDVDPRRMATLDLHRIKARDGLELPVWVTQPRAVPNPAGGPAAPRPAVVLVHGGPWVRGVRWQWHGEAQFLASRGYVVIEPEFRGSTGYGNRLYRAGYRQWGRAMQDDVADAVRWAAAQGLVDPARVCIAGASYGGYAALMGLVRDPGLYRCGVAWVAVTDPRLMFKWTWGNDISEDARRHELPELLGDPVADADLLADIAPLTHAAKIRAPLLLAHGQLDWRVPVENASLLREALTQAGRPPEFVIYPDEGHGWLRPANRFDFARRMERFLARHLQP